jgi:catechol 2,3-dioxygenase-like lactoylglutathione lyase family enzyme
MDRNGHSVALEMSGVSPMLKTKDLAGTIAFYTKTLGFCIANQINNDGGNPSWCCLRSGRATIMFYSMEDWMRLQVLLR